MLQMLKPNEILELAEGGRCTVRRLLGSGGQGEVYEVESDSVYYALKWYYPHCATKEQITALKYLVNRGAPSEQYLWPLSLVAGKNGRKCGYLMKLRSSEFKSINDLMTRKAEPDYRALCSAGAQLADNFHRLHLQGLCYRDISFGNVFFHPLTGEVLIGDNDNVCVNGSGEVTVLGTPRFMAPEIVRLEAKPSIDTDLFSLSVLLFYMFMLHHPLEGKKEQEIRCMDLPAMRRLYGEAPLFIFDPLDKSNEPVRGQQDNAIIYWQIYPEKIKQLFVQAFTRGIKDPQNGRVRESQWRKAFRQLRDSIIHCSSCGSENFYDKDKEEINLPMLCWHCQKPLLLPAFMLLGDNIIMLNKGCKIYRHHFDFTLGDADSDIVAEMAQHPLNPDIWGLRNKGGEKWSVVRPDGLALEIPPEKSFQPINGTKVYFGKGEGRIYSS